MRKQCSPIAPAQVSHNLSDKVIYAFGMHQVRLLRLPTSFCVVLLELRLAELTVSVSIVLHVTNICGFPTQDDFIFAIFLRHVCPANKECWRIGYHFEALITWSSVDSESGSTRNITVIIDYLKYALKLLAH